MIFELLGLDRSVTPSYEAFLSVVHPEDKPLAINRVNEMLNGGETFANELRIMRPNGEMIWLFSSAKATRDASGK